MRGSFQQVNAEDKSGAQRMNGNMQKQVEALLHEIHAYHHHAARLKKIPEGTESPFTGRSLGRIDSLACNINALSVPYAIIPNEGRNAVVHSIVALTVQAFEAGFDIKKFAESLKAATQEYFKQRDAYFTNNENVIPGSAPASGL
jgi:hypothetical protein